jgi:tetratricopeptide (TPR) repeat protein
MEPDFADNYSNLASEYIHLNRLDEAKSVLEDAKSHGLKSAPITEVHYTVDFLEDRKEEIEQLVSGATGDPQLEAELLSRQSDTLAFHGRLRQARKLSRKAMELALRGGAQEMAAVWTANAALREAEFGYGLEAGDQAEKALALASGRMEMEIVAQVLARAGSVARADAIARDLRKRFPEDTLVNKYWLPAIQASIDLGRSRPERAVDVLQRALRYELGTPPPATGLLYPVYLRGEAYLMLHNGEGAIAEFRKILEHPGIVVNSPLGALAHLQLGRAYALVAQGEAARTKYQDFFALWKDADPDIPVLKDAHMEYARLN